MTVVTRFPPSPTGFMHIGTARTALFNWLYARKHGGKMLFRIEDTDRARHSQEAVDALIRAMEWLELDYDGEIVSQHERRDRHAEVAHELLQSGKAWKCYYTADELDAIRKENGGHKLPRRAELEAKYTPSQSEEFTIRIDAPVDGASVVDDQVQGEITVQNAELDDFVLLRSDGSPTYMLAVVLDDHDMGVTHVIRGDDHINNTFRQNVLYEALCWDKPVYAHLPLIHGPDGAKLSKRHGAASVEEYRDMGYLPEAMRNYLLRLGWGHGDDEIISTAQALEWFGFDGMGKGAARFDFDKLESLNAHYIREADTDRLIELCLPFYQSRHDVTPNEIQINQIKACAEELKSRAKTLLQITDKSAFFAKTLPLDFDEKAQGIIEGNQDILKALHERLGKLDAFDKDAVMNECKAIADDMAEGKLGKVGMPLRAALTGTTASPSIFDVAAILGQKDCLARIASAIQ